MKKKIIHGKIPLALSTLTLCCWVASPVSAQSVPGQTSRPVQDNDTTRQELASFDQFLDGHRETAEQLRKDPSLIRSDEFVESHPALQTYLQQHPGVREEINENPSAFMRKESRYDRFQDNRDRDTTRRELASFDQFLDGHREIGEQLRKDPSLVRSDAYLKTHPDLQAYLQDHPEVREEVTENPNVFMRQETRYDRREDTDRDGDTTRRELGSFDQFLDGHREIAEQVRKDPSLIKNDQFVKNHPALQTYLQQHPEVREEIRENPNAFMQQEAHYDHRENSMGDRDTTRRELGSFDQFLDSHREIAEQVRKNPSLVKNEQFVKSHPALQTYLQQHPEVREEVNENPNAFMQQEARYDHRENSMGSDRAHGQFASFGEFLGGHSNISQQLSKDPSLVKNQEYLANHPELQEYLNAHPDVRQQLMANPQNFVKSSQQFSNTSNSSRAATTTPQTDPTKPKP
jgi:dsDNA-binding SOS-regulon protein